jgi:universal stress protein A
MPVQIRKIAVPTDFSDASDRALDYAAALARGTGASLYLIHVLRDQAQYHDARARLAVAADQHTHGIPRVTMEVRDGEPADSIAEAALHYGADLVVLATHARTGLAHLLNGSVAERLIRIASCPVLVLRDLETVRVLEPEAQPQHDGLAGVA